MILQDWHNYIFNWFMRKGLIKGFYFLLFTSWWTQEISSRWYGNQWICKSENRTNWAIFINIQFWKSFEFAIFLLIYSTLLVTRCSMTSSCCWISCQSDDIVVAPMVDCRHIFDILGPSTDNIVIGNSTTLS